MSPAITWTYIPAEPADQGGKPSGPCKLNILYDRGGEEPVPPPVTPRTGHGPWGAAGPPWTPTTACGLLYVNLCKLKSTEVAT